jgi:hypothetical protein
MPRGKDTKADKALKGAQRESSEIAVSLEYDPVCQIDNAVVQEIWDKLAPPLIQAKIINFATEELFTELCFTIMVMRQMRNAIANGDTAWFEEVQNYGDGGAPIMGVKEAGQLKTYRLWSSRYQELLKSLSLRPKDMAGLWHLGKQEDDEDLFS